MGDQLGPYLLDKRIGAGGMADVFLAQGPRGVCVIKRPHPHLCANPDFVRMFLDEASLLAQLHHPGIAQIYDLGHVGGVYYLAMEYVPGFDLMTISLEHERQGELIAADLCARIVADAADALHAAHEAKGKNGVPMNLIHRDVTPHNILLSTSGEVKLIDFGVARVNTAMHRTQAGFVKGKYPYMAPEQITGQAIDRRVDVYALGLVLYELLTNVRAIPGNNEIEQIDNARSSRIRPIEQLRPNLSVPLRQIIASCIYPDPEGRYPTALAVKEDLEKYLRFERHVVGREDLLRLFRVVAAEVRHVAGPSAMPSEAERLTEREQPISAVVLPETGHAEDAPSLAVSPTKPSFQQLPPTSPEPAPPQPEGRTETPHARRTEPGKPPSARGLLVAIAVLSVAVVAVGGLVVQRLITSAALEADAGVEPVVDAGEGAAPFVFDVSDAGESDAGDETEPVAGASPFVDAGPASHDPGTIKLTCEPVAEVMIDKHALGRTPLTLELEPGPHTLLLVNKAERFRRVVSVKVESGELRTVAVVGRKGTLRLKIAPFAVVKLNGEAVPGPAISFKELELYEGTYLVELELDAADVKVPRRKKQSVTIKAGEVSALDVQMME